MMTCPPRRLVQKLIWFSSAGGARNRQTVAVVIGPTSAPRPDTLDARVDERTGRFSLPGANHLRPGIYTVRLAEITYARLPARSCSHPEKRSRSRHSFRQAHGVSGR